MTQKKRISDPQSKHKQEALCEGRKVVNRFWGAAVLIGGKILSEKSARSACLGGWRQDEPRFHGGKGQVSFQNLEKSDIPAKGDCPLASMRSISNPLYLTKLHKANLPGKKVEPFGVIRSECIVVRKNLRIFPKIYRSTVFIKTEPLSRSSQGRLRRRAKREEFSAACAST